MLGWPADEQMVPASWVRRSTDAQVPFESPAVEKLRGYGYLWRLPTNLGQNAACASGRGGQMICLLPAYDTVVVVTVQQLGGTTYGGPDVLEMIEAVIVPAVKG